MNDPKGLIVLTDDNWADYFPFDSPESLVQGLEIGEGGIHLEGRVCPSEGESCFQLIHLPVPSGRNSFTSTFRTMTLQAGSWCWMAK